MREPDLLRFLHTARCYGPCFDTDIGLAHDLLMILVACSCSCEVHSDAVLYHMYFITCRNVFSVTYPVSFCTLLVTIALPALLPFRDYEGYSRLLVLV